MKRSAVCSVVVDSGRESLVSSAGGLLLARTLHCSGLEKAMSAALAPWRAPRAVHDPAKVLTDMAIAVALGGDCAADVADVPALAANASAAPSAVCASSREDTAVFL